MLTLTSSDTRKLDVYHSFYTLGLLQYLLFFLVYYYYYYFGFLRKLLKRWNVLLFERFNKDLKRFEEEPKKSIKFVIHIYQYIYIYIFDKLLKLDKRYANRRVKLDKVKSRLYVINVKEK